MTVEGAQTWQRVFDSGSSAGGEVDEPGGGGLGDVDLIYVPEPATFILLVVALSALA